MTDGRHKKDPTDPERRRPSRGFSAVLREEIGAAGIASCDLAKRMGVTSSYVSALSKGKKNPGPAVVDKIADAIGVSGLARRRLHLAAARGCGFRF